MAMRPARLRVSAAGFSPWIPLNPTYSNLGVAIAGYLSSNGNLTWSCEHTYDDIYAETVCPASRVTTTLTINKPNHGLSVGSWVYLSGTPWDGAYSAAAITDQNNFTVTVPNSGATVLQVRVQTARVTKKTDLTDKTTTAEAIYNQAPIAVRALVSVFTAGYLDFEVISSGN